LEKNERKDIDKGPEGWLIPVIESSYSKLVPREQILDEEPAEIEDTPERKAANFQHSNKFTFMLSIFRQKKKLYLIPVVT
jgi:hypothetical protein